MRITEVRALPVGVPRQDRFLPRTAHGETLVSTYVLVEVETDEGIVGLGEVTCDPLWNGEEAVATTRLLRTALADVLLGRDPLNCSAVLACIARITRQRPFLRAAVEMACLDITGRYLGVPVSTLLGGACLTQAGLLRGRIDTKIVLPAREVERVADMARDLRQHDLSTVKVKVGTGLQEDLARVTAVREIFGPETAITVDANEGWRPFEARKALPALEELGVVAIEQPLPREAWLDSASLRSQTGMVIFGDEAIWTPVDVVRAGATGAFDAVSVYPGKCGGMREALTMARIAGSLGMGVTFGSNLELGVGSAALAHAIAACPELTPELPSDLIGPLYFESSLISDDSCLTRAGLFVGWQYACCPTAPGLGVELDREAVERYRLDL